MIDRWLGRLAGEELTFRENVAEYGLLGTVQAVWLGVRLWWRPPGLVLWGAREGLDVQYGSKLDRWLYRREHEAAQLRRRQEETAARMVHIGVMFQDAFSPAMRDAEVALRAFGKAYTRGMRRAQSDAAAAIRAGLRPPSNERG